jgi:hypothetical protein
MQPERRTDRDLAALAARQHGVVSSRQLLELGYSRSATKRAVTRFRLHRVHRGVYAVGHARLTRYGHCLAAVLACAPQAVASHSTAAWLWGIASPATTIHITAPTRRHTRRGLRIHYAQLTENDRDVSDEIPVTSVARTLLDLAGMVSSEQIQRVVDRAEALGLFDLRAVDDLFERVTRHPAAGRLQRALALYRPTPFTRSRFELRFLERVREAGLPAPSMNFNVAGFELDAYWPAERFAVELDVYETHGRPRAFESDRLRQEDLKLAGVEMTRVTAHRLDREPDEVMRRLGMLLEQRRRELR